jgi:hypothetical protein
MARLTPRPSASRISRRTRADVRGGHNYAVIRLTVGRRVRAIGAIRSDEFRKGLNPSYEPAALQALFADATLAVKSDGKDRANAGREREQ